MKFTEVHAMKIILTNLNEKQINGEDISLEVRKLISCPTYWLGSGFRAGYLTLTSKYPDL